MRNFRRRHVASFRRPPNPMSARLAVVGGGAVVLLAVGGVHLAPATPPPVSGSVELAPTGDSWTSPPLDVDATVVGVAWTGDGPDRTFVRAREDGRWGPWTEAHDTDDHGPDPGSAEGARGERSEAVYVGKASAVQVRIVDPPADATLEYVDTSGRSLPLAERMSLQLGRIRFGGGDRLLAAPAAPDIHPRSEWGGDACLAQSTDRRVETVERVELLFVHHTVHSASANAYTAADVPDLLYAMCSYHVTAEGWKDIGYNALVDKFGRVWEGRAGGTERGVMGAHTGGFNSVSTGLAFIGDHRSTAPTPAAEDAFIRYAAWKLDVHHVDPLSVVRVESNGSSRFAAGTTVDLRAVSGHRDVSLTSCPGDAALSGVDGWRQRIAATGGPKIFGGWPDRSPVAGSEASGWEPVTYDFRFTETMSWTFVVSDPSGGELFRRTGAGSGGSVVWDGTAAGAPLPHGTYTSRLEAVPLSGAPAPRPAIFDVELGAFTPPFADDDGSPHEADIATIAGLGITAGCAPDLYCPAEDVRRWQMALFLTRLHGAAGGTVPPGTPGTFTDIGSLPAEHRAAVESLAALGVTSGTAPGLFDPDGTVFRWQMALFLTRIAEAGGATLPDVPPSPFGDIAALPPEAQLAVNRLAALGITSGTAPGTFSPGAAVTREQMATFLARTLTVVQGASL